MGCWHSSDVSLTWRTQWTQKNLPVRLCNLSRAVVDRSWSDWITKKFSIYFLIIFTIKLYGFCSSTVQYFAIPVWCLWQAARILSQWRTLYQDTPISSERLYSIWLSALEILFCFVNQDYWFRSLSVSLSFNFDNDNLF